MEEKKKLYYKKEEFEQEQQHLDDCIEIIDEHIKKYGKQLSDLKVETKELYDNYRSDNPELHNDLVIRLDWKYQVEQTLKKNLLARNKPYFGKINYMEQDSKENVTLYIGKNGIMKDTSTSLIIDWRAPVASIYYDSDIGESSYISPFGEPIFVQLNLKRSFEIENGKLLDFYDTDVIANDEFLTKYLSKNKEVVLGEIIATIQKEQNDIIRDTPWHSVIVQGVAGSGKTTVAMHRISYILYNYKKKFQPEEFYIIGSNKMLLNYITSVLPNLDVYYVNQMTMFEFFQFLLDKDFPYKKKKFQYIDAFSKNNKNDIFNSNYKSINFKGSLEYVTSLQTFLNIWEYQLLRKKDIFYQEKMILSTKEVEQWIQSFSYLSIQEKIDILNKQLINKVKNECLRLDFEKEEIQRETKRFKNYFGKKSEKVDYQDIYVQFLTWMSSIGYWDKESKVKSQIILEQFLGGNIDLYDMAMITLIKKKHKAVKDFSLVKHIVVDEAQDFGVSIFAVLKNLFLDCTYTIMGDTNQNIYYNTGMNDWKELREHVFSTEKDKFYSLEKSYRNTIEISNYASHIIEHGSFEIYKIQPILRHGNPVVIKQLKTNQEMILKIIEYIQEIQNRGYNTIAIICRSIEEAEFVEQLLKKTCQISFCIKGISEQDETLVFTNGIMILPIHMTKGLEFDAVILWNPDKNSYPHTNAAAKLLYVAVTRALHELYIIYKNDISELLSDDNILEHHFF